jgi:hypothetical protein
MSSDRGVWSHNTRINRVLPAASLSSRLTPPAHSDYFRIRVCQVAETMEGQPPVPPHRGWVQGLWLAFTAPDLSLAPGRQTGSP